MWLKAIANVTFHVLFSLVPISEASVIVAISSPHRAESLSALQYCINTLKATVPIWKKVCAFQDFCFEKKYNAEHNIVHRTISQNLFICYQICLPPISSMPMPWYGFLRQS